MLSSDKHYYGFDYLRAFFIVVIVAWHSDLFSYLNNYPSISYIAEKYITLLAVPIFFQVALYLYASKSIANKHDFPRRLRRLSILYLFWFPVNLILTSDGNIRSYFTGKETVYTLMGNRTVTYFLFSLLVLTILTELVIRLCQKYSIRITFITILFVISLIVMIFGNQIALTLIHLRLPVGYASPINFIPYVFSSILLVAINDKIENTNGNFRPAAIIILSVLMLLFAFAEWFAYSSAWKYFDRTYFNYCRVSLVLAAMLLVLIFKGIKRKPKRAVMLLSNLSLGIFVIHNVIIHYILLMSEDLQVLITPPLITLLSLVLSMTLAGLLKNKTSLV